MCGIAGILGREPDTGTLERMLDNLGHRGPDDSGTFSSGRIALGMRRLSIIDLKQGHQPILSDDGSLAIVFNGEIYNYLELRKQLETKGIKFRTQSDTEVILKLYEVHGSDFIEYLRGMFTFAIADTARRQVFIARDRLGVKPLYMFSGDGMFVFASEIKAVLQHPRISRDVNPDLLEDYLSLRYVPGPGTLFRNIQKFPAAHWMIWREGEVRWHRYWSLPERSEASAVRDQDCFDRFAELFDESVSLRMISDVPLGAFLSGGLDSSAIVASMAGRGHGRVNTFSIGFDWEDNELEGARRTAELLNCSHHEINCGSQDFEYLPQAIWNLDEPVGDAIIMPMFLLARLARKHVKVVLSGEGADETMAGYFTHKVLSLTETYRKIPWPLRALARSGSHLLPASVLNRLFDYPADLGQRGRDRLLDYLRVIERGDLHERYRFIISLFTRNELDALWPDRPAVELARCTAPADLAPLERILRLQYDHWLPDDILCKQDKMTMAHSLEGRVPFMDHKLVEFLATVPAHLKLSNGSNKIILRKYLSKNLPHLSRHKKVPFYIPIEKYLNRGPLREMVRDVLSERSVRRRGLFRWAQVKQLLEGVEHTEFLYGKQVFSLLALELWFRIFIDGETGWGISQPLPDTMEPAS